MDQDFYKGIEPSSMSVEDILREFYAQEEGTAAPGPEVRRAERPPQSRRERSAPPRHSAPPQRRSDATAKKRETPRSPIASLRSRIPSRESPANNSRAARAETEKPMDFESEKQQTGAGEGKDGLDVFGDLFRSAPEELSPLETPADGLPSQPAEEAVSLSLEDILKEYDKVFAEKPVEAAAKADPEKTQFFTPKKPDRDAAPRASAEDYAAFAAGTSAVASSKEKISALSAMADEAMRYMNSLTDEDYDRMAAAPKPAAPAKRDAGVERYNLSGHEEKMVFGDKELDLSADESYVPPVQKSEPIYHWTAGEEDLPDAPTEKPGLLQRIMSFNGSRRGEKKRPLNAPARRSRSAYPTTLTEAEQDAVPAGAQDSSGGKEADADDTVVFAVPAEKADAPAADDFSFDFTFDDSAAAPAAYAPGKDYAPPEDAEERDGTTEDAEEDAPAAAQRPEKARRRLEEALPLDENGEFPSFAQYVSSLITGTLYRLRGFSSNPNSVTMDTDGEDLGPEVAPAAASKYYGSAVPSLRMRFRIGLGLLAILAWISLGLPVSGMLRTVKVAAGMCLALQLVIMLLSLDVITTAAVNMARLRFGADSLAALTCVLTSFDALAVALDAFGTPHMPLCLLSSLSLLGVLYSSLLAARGLRKALRVPSIAKRCYSVTGESELKGKGITLLKTDRPIVGFVRRTEEAGPDETAFLRAAPALLILSLIFAVVIAAARHAGGDFLYILTALLSPAVPVTALLCFSLPYFLGSNRIFYSGAAVAGWSGLSDVGRSQNLIITDRDLFPEGSVEVDTVRIFADAEPEKILSYAGTMILASGSGIAPCFAELMNRNGGTMRHVDNFEFLPGGGMKGVIDGSTVLCGGTELMRLMNVRIPYRLVDKTTVLLAVDGVLYGIFNMKYLPQPQVRKALIGLIRSSRHPVFAVRDFNVNPEMLRELFEVATDGYDFPPYMERFKLSEAPADSEAPIAAVICREGLGPLSLMADTGRSMYLATRLNLIVTLIAAVAGVFTVFIRFLTVGQVGVPFLFAFLVLWALPVAAASLFLKF